MHNNLKNSLVRAMWTDKFASNGVSLLKRFTAHGRWYYKLVNSAPALFLNEYRKWTVTGDKNCLSRFWQLRSISFLRILAAIPVSASEWGDQQHRICRCFFKEEYRNTFVLLLRLHDVIMDARRFDTQSVFDA